MSDAIWLFIAGQALALVVFIIRWYIQHDRIKEKIKVLEASCSNCRTNMEKDMGTMRDELSKDIEEIKADLRSVKTELSDFKVSTTGTLAEIKTLLTKTAQG